MKSQLKFNNRKLPVKSIINLTESLNSLLFNRKDMNII